MRRLTIIVAAQFFILATTGCSSYFEQPKNIDEVLKDDPGFSVALNKKKALDEKIKTVEAEFKKEKDNLSAKLKQLEAELKGKRQSANRRIQEIKGELAPERDALKGAIKKTRRELSDKYNMLKNIDKMLLDVAKLLQKGDDLKMSEVERAKWSERQGSLNVQKEALKKEMQDIEEKLRLLRSEERLLRQ